MHLCMPVDLTIAPRNLQQTAGKLGRIEVLHGPWPMRKLAARGFDNELDHDTQSDRRGIANRSFSSLQPLESL